MPRRTRAGRARAGGDGPDRKRRRERRLTPAQAREREGGVGGGNDAGQKAGNGIAAAGTEHPLREVAGEADARKEQHEHPQLARPDPAQGTNWPLGEQRQDDDGHDAEAGRRPHLLVVYPCGEIVQP